MQQRSEPHDSLDDFPTPPWATRALCERLAQTYEHGMHLLRCREPAANRGHMALPLSEYFGWVEASDIHDYGAGYPQCDYLFGPSPKPVDWTITNPPFRLAQQFIERMRETSTDGCAVLVRSAFLEGVNRFRELFEVAPPSHVLQFTERVPMHRGKLTATGSTATAYCWVVWDHAHLGHPTQFEWIAPCRRRLERDGDYPAEGSP